MKRLIAALLASACAALHAEPVFVLSPAQMHYPIPDEMIAAVLRDGDAFAKAARLETLRPAGDFELRVLVSPFDPDSQGRRTAYVLTRDRLTVYALRLSGDRLRAVQTSRRRLPRGTAPVAELRAAWDVAGRLRCDVSDSGSASFEASLDGKPVVFWSLDISAEMCTHDDASVKMTALLLRVRALAGR